jgi:hypothetical protein
MVRIKGWGIWEYWITPTDDDVILIAIGDEKLVLRRVRQGPESWCAGGGTGVHDWTYRGKHKAGHRPFQQRPPGDIGLQNALKGIVLDASRGPCVRASSMRALVLVLNAGDTRRGEFVVILPMEDSPQSFIKLTNRLAKT